MEKDKETDSGSNDTSEANSSSISDAKPPKRKGINLLKRSKHDLLRLLSILEGELEARDIFISTLQAQLNNQKNARQQYFVHRMNDPFLALHHDDYSTGKSSDKNQASKNELVHIEPLPLLEKVAQQFKSQQHKMHQQMALASKIHRKMAHELAEERRKHAVDTKTGDDVTMALEKERERLNASVMCEKERTKRIETEYKKLLVLCKDEGRKHKMIVMGLLAEQERLLQQLKQSRELQIDIDSTETELQARLHEALKEKQELALKLKEEQNKSSGLRKRMITLEQQVSKFNSNKVPVPQNSAASGKSALAQAVSLYACDENEKEEQEEDAPIPELPIKKSRASSTSSSSSVSSEDSPSQNDIDPVAAFMSKHHPMSIAQNTQDVTLVHTSSHPPILLADGVGVTTSGYYSVRPGSSIAGLEAIKSSATNKEILSLDFSKDDDVFVSSKKASKNPEPTPPIYGPKPFGSTVPPKPNRFIPGSPHYIPFRSTHSLFNDKTQSPLASSPTTSGAANFAMNSPNAPNPPLGSPFSLTRSPTVKANPKSMTNKGEAPSKLSSFIASSGRSPARPGQNTQFQSTRMKFQSAQSGPNDNSSTNQLDSTKSKEDFVTERKMQSKKFTSVSYRSHITQKVSTSASTLPNVTKLSNLPKTESSSSSESERTKQPLPPKTRPSTAPTTAGSQARPPPLPPKKPSLSSEKSTKRTTSIPDANESQGPTIQRKSGSVKRTMPLTPTNENRNTNGNGTNKTVKGPTPPSLPVKMSSHSQQPSPPAGPRQPPQQR